MGALTVYLERGAGGAHGPEFDIGLIERVLISGRSFWFYLGKLAWPYPLIFIYPRWKVDAGVWWQWLFVLAAVAALAGAWVARRRVGKGLFAALMHFYVSTSLLVLFLVLYMMRYSFVADHWAYFGSLGVIAWGAAAITRAMNKAGEEWAVPLKVTLGACIAVGLGTLTWIQSSEYKDAETLCQAILGRNAQCWAAWNDLGMTHLQESDFREAADDFESALRLEPSDAQAHNNLAAAFLQLGSIDAALREYRAALRLRPDYQDARFNMGGVLLMQGLLSEAEKAYRTILEDDPNDEEAHDRLGCVLAREGRMKEAIDEFRASLNINSADADARRNLADALKSHGDANR